MLSDDELSPSLLALTADIVSAHVRKNPLPAADLPALIRGVHAALATAHTAPSRRQEPAPAEPAARETIFPDYLVCLEDGRKFRTLRRHLAEAYGLTPEKYREKWGLPDDYPMVAPNYAAKRSALAREIGLGRKSGGKPAPASVVPEAAPEPAPSRSFVVEAPAPRPEPRDLSPEAVFARFPTRQAVEEPAEPPPPDLPGPARPGGRTRKPFAKQLARSMRS